MLGWRALRPASVRLPVLRCALPFGVVGLAESACVLAGCARPGPDPVPDASPVDTTAAPASGDLTGGTVRTLAPGDTFSVVLQANRTTGYDWEAAVPPVLLLTDGPRYVTDPAAAAEGRVGAGGTMTWRFRAVEEGLGALVFDYRRPWQQDTPPAQTVRYDVVVTPPGGEQ